MRVFFSIHMKSILLILISVLTVAACGGGGADGSTDNTAPIANAGDDQVVTRLDTVTLNGSDSYDSDGDPLTYTWTQTAGADVTSGAGMLSGITPSFSAPGQADTLIFTLQVSDGDLTSSPDNVIVEVLSPSAVAVENLCPLDSTNQAPTNSWISVAYDALIEPSSVVSDAISVVCNGIAINGTISTKDNIIAFSPNSALITGELCDVSVLSTVEDIDGNTVPSTTWSFVVGDREGRNYQFETRKTVVDNSIPSVYLKKVLVEQNSIFIVSSSGASIIVSVSTDGGNTFSSSDRIQFADIGSIQNDDVDIYLDDSNVVHIVVIVNGEAIYLQSTNSSLVSYEIKGFLTNPLDDYVAHHANILVDQSGIIKVLFSEICNTSPTCNFSFEGNYLLTSSDGGNYFESYDQISPGTLINPNMVDAKDNRIFTFFDTVSNMVTINTFDGALTEIGQLTGNNWKSSSGALFVDTNADGEAHIGWYEYDPTDLLSSDYHFGWYNGISQSAPPLADLTPATTLYQESTIENWCINQTAGNSGKFAYLFGVVTNPIDGVTSRKIYISDDKGANYYYPYSFDFLREGWVTTSTDPIDSLCPDIKFGQSHEIILTWKHTEVNPNPGSDFTEIQFTKGVSIPPCGWN